MKHLLPAVLLVCASGTGLAAQAPSAAFPAATPESQGMSDEALAALVEEVEGYVERELLVGGELVVIRNRRTVLQHSFGHRDREKDEPWTDGTVCNVRSMTKPLTGAAAQLLVERGELSLDDRVARYLPGFDTDAARKITVRQLLTHRAGLPLTILSESLDEFPNLVEMGNAVGTRGPEFEPGSRFWYSDAGTDALGAVVEVVAGRPLDHFVEEELLVPLGMRESFYFLDDEDPRRERIASLYVGAPGSWTRFLDPMEGSFYPYAWGSQSLYSTPRDYARFLAMWMDRGRWGEDVVLPEAAVERALTPASEMSMLGSPERFPTFFTGLEVFYGQMAVLHLPRAAEGEGPPTIIGHSGSDGTIAWAWPRRDLMILCFTQSRGTIAVLRLEEAIDRLLLSPDGEEGEDEVPAELQPYLGVYVADWAHHMKEDFTVQYSRGRLSIDVPTQMVYVLEPAEEPGKWHFAVVPAIAVWFEQDAEGSVNCLRIRQGGLTFEAPRKGTPHAAEVAEANRPDPAVVGKYLGLYHDPEEDAPAEVLVDGDYLAVRTAEGHVFHLWEVPGQSVWQVRENPLMALSFQEEDGRVVSCTRHGPGGELVLRRED